MRCSKKHLVVFHLIPYLESAYYYIAVGVIMHPCPQES